MAVQESLNSSDMNAVMAIHGQKLAFMGLYLESELATV